MSKFGNSRKNKAIKKIIPNLIEETDLETRSKFNLSFLDENQKFASTLKKAEKKELYDIISKIKDYSRSSLSYWKGKRIGGGSGKVLAEYKTFPENSDFEHPSHVPKNVSWARFRMQGKYRLIGFLVPKEMEGKTFYSADKNSYCLDTNTFYVVFLDPEHNFYKT